MVSRWEDPERVDAFASREADVRLTHFIASGVVPAGARVLDLGCAGGRNAELLAQRGFDLHALDAAAAMVARTRERVAAVLNRSEAERRVQRGVMDDLSRYAPFSFELVVAIGIYHCARSLQEWERAIAETVRVLASGGRLLLSQFAPGTVLEGTDPRAVEGEIHVYELGTMGRHCLIPGEELDRHLQRFGLQSERPTEQVVRSTERGQRVTVNGLYRKKPASRDLSAE